MVETTYESIYKIIREFFQVLKQKIMESFTPHYMEW